MRSDKGPWKDQEIMKVSATSFMYFLLYILAILHNFLVFLVLVFLFVFSKFCQNVFFFWINQSSQREESKK